MTTRRTSRTHATFVDAYEALCSSTRRLLSHEDPNIRARVCNLIGNMCRHSAFFYSSLEKHGLIPQLIERCGDPDKGTRKFACFAIGNAGAWRVVNVGKMP